MPVFSPDPNLVRSSHLSAEQFMSCCDQIWSADKRSSKTTDQRAPSHDSVVYAKRDHVSRLFRILRKQGSRVALVTAESDDAVTPIEDVPAQVDTWFSTNSQHPDVRALPLGLGNSYCKVTTKAADLAAAIGAPKSKLLYLNFRPDTNRAARQPLWESYERAELGGWATRVAGQSDSAAYARDLAAHHFVLCPPGNGIDTHRLWETLYAGSIPVVLRNSALNAFGDLPILFVDDLAGLDRSFFEKSLASMGQGNPPILDKLFLPYWRGEIETSRRKIGRKISAFGFLRETIRAKARRCG